MCLIAKLILHLIVIQTNRVDWILKIYICITLVHEPIKSFDKIDQYTTFNRAAIFFSFGVARLLTHGALRKKQSIGSHVINASCTKKTFCRYLRSYLASKILCRQ